MMVHFSNLEKKNLFYEKKKYTTKKWHFPKMEPQIPEKLRVTTQDKIWTKILRMEDLSLNTNFPSFLKKIFFFISPAILDEKLHRANAKQQME